MVIVIQHTQAREQTATQRKLDELLRALPEAQTSLMMLEEASDGVIQDVHNEHRSSKEREDKRTLRESAGGGPRAVTHVRKVDQEIL